MTSGTHSHYAEHFEEYRGFLNRTVRSDLRSFGIPMDADILDMGCAFGDDMRRLRELGYRSVKGVEPDPYCVGRCGDLDVRLGTIEATGLPDASFDAVLVDSVFHHVPDYAAALREVRRVLRPRGLLCFVEPRRSIARQLLDILTFHSPLPALIGGPLRLRHTVLGEEFETGLYPLWLRSHGLFFRLLAEGFDEVWLRKDPFFFRGKFQLRAAAASAR